MGAFRLHQAGHPRRARSGAQREKMSFPFGKCALEVAAAPLLLLLVVTGLSSQRLCFPWTSAVQLLKGTRATGCRRCRAMP